MAKSKSIYVCSECGYESAKWYGKCPGCGEWNTMNEEVPVVASAGTAARSRGISRAVAVKDVVFEDEQRYHTGLGELDRVLGGGIVKGSIVLLGGDPGIGKSTILLQVCQFIGETCTILYVSGEELTQSSPGSITQVRECTNALMHTAKDMEIPILLVGHVNKDGAIAGPKVLEHIVDAVLFFEGDRNMSYRILRAVKNRYGSTNEIGVFEMRDTGLCEVPNPSMMLLSGRPKNVSGSCVACIMEGTRPILAEVQGLVTPTCFGNPRRMSTGFDYNRMSLLLAVLEKRAGYFFSNQDAFLNVIGGLRLDEPAADLTVSLALVSSLKDVPVSQSVIAFGEVGLAGEIRAVSHAMERVKEAARLGFQRIILPRHNMKALTGLSLAGVELIPVRNVREAFEASLG